jgi:hypothetical protein
MAAKETRVPRFFGVSACGVVCGVVSCSFRLQRGSRCLLDLVGVVGGAFCCSCCCFGALVVIESPQNNRSIALRCLCERDGERVVFQLYPSDFSLEGT